MLASMLTSLTLLPLLLTGAQQWIPHETGTDASLRGLCAVDARVCWASGANGTVLRTVDGETWSLRPVAGAEELDFRDVHAFDAERALVISAGAPARVYRTEDGGASWTLTYENDDERAFFDAMDFWDERRGLAFSDPIDGRLFVIATDDGGRSWRTLPRDAFPDSPAGEAGFAASGTCLRVSGAQEAWIGLGGPRGARVFHTADGGASWKAARTPVLSGESSTGIFSLLRLEGGRGVAVGGDYAKPELANANAAVTLDGGTTWTSVRANAPRGYRSCVDVAAGTGGSKLFAVGPTGSDVSTDGGHSWRALSDTGFHAVSCAADGSVWASGSDGRIAKLAPQRTAAWSRFRGPNGTGIAASGSYPAEIGPDTNVVWKRAFPEGHSSPALSATRIFLTGMEDGKLFTYAVDRATGETVWRKEAPRPRKTKFHPKNHSAAATAVVDADTVVVFFDEFGALAYDHDGEELWRHPMGPFDNVYGMGASPVLAGGVVVIPCDQSTGSYVVGLSKADGSVLWKVDRPRAISGHCTPVLRSSGERTEVLLPGSYLLDAYDATSGERLWWVGGLPSEMKSVPVLIGDTLWIHGFASPLNNRGNQIEFEPFAEALKNVDADGDGLVSVEEIPHRRARPYFQFVDLDANGSLDAEEWAGMRDMFGAVNAALAIRVGGKGDVTDGAVLWRSYRGIPQLPSPLVYADTYYMLNDQGGLLATLSPGTGETIEKGRLEEAVDNYFASPVAGDDKVYILSEAGLLSVLAAGKGLEPLHSADFGEQCYATPALEDDRIWLRTHATLYCFGEDR